MFKILFPPLVATNRVSWHFYGPDLKYTKQSLKAASAWFIRDGCETEIISKFYHYEALDQLFLRFLVIDLLILTLASLWKDCSVMVNLFRVYFKMRLIYPGCLAFISIVLPPVKYFTFNVKNSHSATLRFYIMLYKLLKHRIRSLYEALMEQS